MKPTNYFLIILFTAFLLWIGCKCNDCPPTFEETKNGCSCPDGTFKFDDKCLKLSDDKYFLPIENMYCFDTMSLQILTKFCDTTKVICDTHFYAQKYNSPYGNNAGGSGTYYFNKILGDSIYSDQIDQCILKNAPTLGIKGRKHKDDGKWHCTLFIWDYTTGPTHPFKELEVILQK